MRLVVVDVIPALLSWEGRDASEAAPNALEVLDDLFSSFRLAAITESDRAGVELREVLDLAGLSGFFDSIGTAAGFGPAVTPRVVRRIAEGLGVDPDLVIVVTARPALAEALQRARITTVLTEGPEAFDQVPATIADLIDDLPTP